MNQAPPIRILVVDDEPEVRFVLTEFLESRGYEVTAAESGPQALAMVEEVAPHVAQELRVGETSEMDCSHIFPSGPGLVLLRLLLRANMGHYPY